MSDELKTYLKTEGKDLLKNLGNPVHQFRKGWEVILRNTEGQGNPYADGLSVITGSVRSNYYDGKNHNNNSKPFVSRVFGAENKITNEHYDPNQNYIRLYALRDATGFKRSKYNPGIYMGTKYEKLPGYEGNYYNIEHLEIPEYMKPYVDQLGWKTVSIDKDFLLNDPYINVDNTYDARNHYVTVSGNAKNPTVRFDDVFDIKYDWINKLNNPTRVIQVLNSEYVPNEKQGDARNATESIMTKVLGDAFPNYLPEVIVTPE